MELLYYGFGFLLFHIGILFQQFYHMEESYCLLAYFVLFYILYYFILVCIFVVMICP